MQKCFHLLIRFWVEFHVSIIDSPPPVKQHRKNIIQLLHGCIVTSLIAPEYTNQTSAR